MRDARYLRAQAELCLEMARQVSDRATADNLRAEAARYHAEAAEIETGGCLELCQALRRERRLGTLGLY